MYLSIYYIIQLLANIAFIPYFYNYYNWINNAKDSKDKTLLEEMGKQNNIYYVSGWVDSQNSYGAMVRTNIKNFKIKDENGILMIKSNAKVMASNSFIKLFAANWVFSLIVTVITFVIIYAIISSL